MNSKHELYRKYRPKSYEDMVGNETAIKSLKSELENGARVFLLHGNAGCGKTTLARICANEIGAGELSIREINSANNRGIDTAREIMEQMRYNPSDGENLVWIIDEVHKTTNDWQNAMLKATEDTPDHVYFFLCTTDPNKLIAPLRSRCSAIALKPLSAEKMTYLLKRTARAEKRKVGEDVLERIVEQADGGSRKALKLLGKVLFLEDEKEQKEALQYDDASDAPETIELCRALLDNKTRWKDIAPLLKNMDWSDPEKIRYAVMGYATAVLLSGKMMPRAVGMLECFIEPTYSTGKNGIVLACLNLLSDG